MASGFGLAPGRSARQSRIRNSVTVRSSSPPPQKAGNPSRSSARGPEAPAPRTAVSGTPVPGLGPAAAPSGRARRPASGVRFRPRFRSEGPKAAGGRGKAGASGAQLAPSEHGPDPGRELPQGEGFGQVVVAPSSRPRTRSSSSSREVRMMTGTESPRARSSRSRSRPFSGAWRYPGSQAGAGPGGVQGFPGRETVRGLADPESVALQGRAYGGAQILVVVRHKDRRIRRFRHRLSR